MAGGDDCELYERSRSLCCADCLGVPFNSGQWPNYILEPPKTVYIFYHSDETVQQEE